jgi:hypothetical protein
MSMSMSMSRLQYRGRPGMLFVTCSETMTSTKLSQQQNQYRKEQQFHRFVAIVSDQ